LDYKIPDGELALLNIVSHGTTTTEQHSEQYTVQNAPSNKDVITLGTSLQTNNLNVVTDILSYKQTFGALEIEAKISNAYSDNATPNGWYMDFQQQSAGTSNISSNLTPSDVAHQAQSMIDLGKMYWTDNSAWHDFSKQDDKQAALDIENSFDLSDLISLTLKGGGAYKYTTRYYNYDYAAGLLNIRAAAQNGARQNVIQQLPWLQDPPYNLDPAGTNFFTIHGFYDSGMNFGKFFNGEYSMYSAINAGIIDRMMSIMQSYRAVQGGSPDQPVFDYDSVSSKANDYSGYEVRSAGYLMATVDVGPWITITPGVRYQALRTSYTAAHFLNYDDGKINKGYPYTIVTDKEYHGYWLPDITMKYSPSDVISFRASFTNTLSYPDFNTFIPKEDIGMENKFVNWNNTAIKPERAHNYDFQVSVHDNTIGLFAVSPFLKTIDDEIYNPGKIYLDTNKIRELGFPSYTNLFTLNTYINNPYQIKVWGIETEWQTHFWYLPNPFDGLVMNINYTHIYSQGQFPYTLITHPTRFSIAYVDTSFFDRLYQQPNDVANLSVGYDYRKFSILVSLIYQSNVFDQSNFWWTLRSDKAKYLRWDLSVKQGLPLNGVDIYLDVNNINKEADTYLVRKNGFPTSEYNYGLNADAGIRWNFY
jgi:TonB-dependent receptor